MIKKFLEGLLNRFKEPLSHLAMVLAGAIVLALFFGLGIDFLLFVIVAACIILFVVPDKMFGRIADYLQGK